jgi:bacillithiol biosynthesis deacetylase BshB1
MSRILAVGPHPDDVELGCGGTLILAARAGLEGYVLDLTRGELGSNGTPEERQRESAQAARILGVRERINAGLPDGFLDRNDSSQRATLVEIVRRVRPHLVLLPYLVDDHPDHVEGSHLVSYALYLAGLARYPAGGEPWRADAVAYYPARTLFEPTHVVDVSGVREEKMEAVSAHRTQFLRGGRTTRETPINDPAFFDALARRSKRLGSLVGRPDGEAFLFRGAPGEPVLDGLFIAVEGAEGEHAGEAWE